MSVADVAVPTRLLAGGGPGSPHPTVLRAMTTPVIGQFDPDFTAVMDDVMTMGRHVLQTQNARCFAVSAQDGLEAVLNTLLEPGDTLAVTGGPRFASRVSDVVRRLGVTATSLERLPNGTKLLVAPSIDPDSVELMNVASLVAIAHAAGAKFVLDASLSLGAHNLPVDDWAIDASVASVDFCLGAPSGMALVTYSAEIASMMSARPAPPRTSYLDLLQLQAYWSPERLNHHTAPTSLIYGLREALRLLLAEGLEACIARHQSVGTTLHKAIHTLGLNVTGTPPYALLHLPPGLDEPGLRRRLLDDHNIYVHHHAPSVWRLGLLAADASLANARRLVLALHDVLAQ